MSHIINIDSSMECLYPGDILFFHDREGFRNSRRENIGFHAQIPDYVVVDEIIGRNSVDPDNFDYLIPTKQLYCSLVGIKRKLPAITDEEYRKFFNKVGNIDSQGYDLELVQDTPDLFSRYYAAGDHEDEGFLNDLMRSMKDYDPHLPKNIENINRILKQRSESGRLYPTQIAELINHFTASLYKAARVGHNGKTGKSYNMLGTTLIEVAMITNGRCHQISDGNSAYTDVIVSED